VKFLDTGYHFTEKYKISTLSRKLLLGLVCLREGIEVFLEARFCNILFSYVYSRASVFCKCRHVYMRIIIIEYERKHNHHHYILLRHEDIPKAMMPLIWPVLSNQQNCQLSKNFHVIAGLLRRAQNYITVCRAPCTSAAVMILNLNWRVLKQKLYAGYCSLRTHTYLTIFFYF
jgi:hypothetical protein